MSTILKVIYRDDFLVAIDKPSGLLVHRSRLAAGETRSALNELGEQLGREVHPCHRLDRPTSGVLLFALDRGSLAKVNAAFQRREVRKVYYAMVRGWSDREGTVTAPLSSGDGRAEKREARTAYSTLSRYEIALPLGRYESARFSLVELRPETGRTHQLRRHMAHLRHPIIGDTRHGDGNQNRFARQQLGCHRLMLHAGLVELKHPETGEALKIAAPLPDDFKGVLDLPALEPR